MVLYVIGAYNHFVSLDQGIKGQWSEVENQYQRQADLIPNLVSTVSSSVSVETKFVKDVVAARASWASASTQLAKDTAGQQMNNGISAFMSAVAENYPTLQANKQYVALTDELSGTQNRITVARGRYIDNIKAFNIAIKKFPGNIIAWIFGFTEKDYYKAVEGSLATPKLGEGVLP
jgi:LemA protein